MVKKTVQYTVTVVIDDNGEFDPVTFRDGIIRGVQQSINEGAMTALDDESTVIEGFQVSISPQNSNAEAASQPTSEVAESNSSPMLVSVNGGRSYSQAKEGVRIIYGRVMVPGEDERGEVHINATSEGIITDVWVTREESLDHNIGTQSQLLDDLVCQLVEDNA